MTSITGGNFMNRKEIIIATEEPKIFDWLHEYLSDFIGSRYGLVSASNKRNFQELIVKAETVTAFIETEFFGDKIIGMLGNLKKQNPKLRIILFSTTEISVDTIARYMWWGADGFLSLRGEPEQIREQLKRIINGERILSSDVWRCIDEYGNIPGKEPHLTHKEAEIVRFLAKEMTKKEIGAVMRKMHLVYLVF
jgi:DNA-binding NarL/FixJ family response regulator